MAPPERFYFAAPFELRLLIRDMAEAIGRRRVTSRWLWPQLDLDELAVERMEPAAAAEAADRDLEDIRLADALVLWTHPEHPGRGSNFEAGFALSIGMPVWRVGPILCPFHALLMEASPHTVHRWYRADLFHVALANAAAGGTQG